MSETIGNAAAMREALSALIPVAEHGLSARTHSLNCTVGATNVEAARALVEQAKEAIMNARATLAAPPRHCDVGTADEQYERYKKCCSGACLVCPVHKEFDFRKALRWSCQLVWAQMPYTEARCANDC